MERTERKPTGNAQTATVVEISEILNCLRQKAGFVAIGNDAECSRAIVLVDSILDAMGDGADDATHPLAPLLDFVSTAIEAYETRRQPMPTLTPREMVRYLMQQNALTQNDLPEIGNQSAVSQFLSGKRGINARQIAALSARFRMSADAFIEPVLAVAA
jgi:HTH-type transcriptional regulator/antitoxin HigA